MAIRADARRGPPPDGAPKATRRPIALDSCVRSPASCLPFPDAGAARLVENARPMDRRDLTATSFVTSRLAVFVLGAVGLFFALQPDWLGWGALSRALGGDDRLVSLGVGVGFLVLAALSYEKNELRVKSAELLEALHQLLYGKSYRAEREAIELLVKSLESGDAERAAIAHTHLMRLTANHFAADPKGGRAWGPPNTRHGRRRRGGAAAPGAAPQGGDPPAPKDGGAV